MLLFDNKNVCCYFSVGIVNIQHKILLPQFPLQPMDVMHYRISKSYPMHQVYHRAPGVCSIYNIRIHTELSDRLIA